MVIFEDTWYDDWMEEWVVSRNLMAWWSRQPMVVGGCTYSPYYHFYGQATRVFSDDGGRNYHSVSSVISRWLRTTMVEYTISFNTAERSFSRNLLLV